MPPMPDLAILAGGDGDALIRTLLAQMHDPAERVNARQAKNAALRERVAANQAPRSAATGARSCCICAAPTRSRCEIPGTDGDGTTAAQVIEDVSPDRRAERPVSTHRRRREINESSDADHGCHPVMAGPRVKCPRTGSGRP
jgi:hypothetical protein